MSDETIRVLLVDDIADTRDNMKKLLLFEEDIEVVGSAGSGEEGIELAKQLRPHVVIMDINMPGIDGITAAEILSRQVPGVQIIMMSVQSEADYLRRSMLAGAREFLIKPPSAEEIVTSIRRVHGLARSAPAPAAPPPPLPGAAATSYATPTAPGAQSPVAPPAPRRSGEVIAVYGTKGGVGTSSVAVNLAVALKELDPDTTVALADTNTEFGVLSVLLNLNADRSIIDLISAEELEAGYVSEVLIPHASGIRVMPGSGPTEAELVTNDQMRRAVTALRDQYDFVIFDTRPTFSEPTLTVLDMADTIVLVTTADIPSIRNTRLFFEVAEQLEYPREKMMLVLNRYHPQGMVSAQAIESSIKHPLAAQLPLDERTANTAIQHGLPFVTGSPRSQLSQATAAFARKLAGVAASHERAPAQERAPAMSEGDRPSLIKRLFGR